jgi:hypothetical protein
MNKTATTIAALIAVHLLAGCGSNPPAPDWQMNARSALERATAAYLSGKDGVETSEFTRAREQIGSTGKIDLAIRAELARCADIAYAAYLAGSLPPGDAARLPEQHRAVAGAGSDSAASAAVLAITDPLSRLVAAGAVFRANRATPDVLKSAVDTASAQGWRRPLLAWLGVQAQRAEQAGDAPEAARLRRRIALASE